jgi:dTDP-3-amino-3,4,6-trideoxy-alpha-D-glucose transaminase
MSNPVNSVPFNDLTRETIELRPMLDAAVGRVLDRGYYILGPECKAFEQAFGDYLDVPHVISVGNGTDAIQIALMALGIGPGDEVICPALTAAPTALAILAVGASPVFADCDPVTYTLDPVKLDAAMSERTRAILPVHLYGLPADIRAIQTFAQKHDLTVIEDAAQGHGACIGTQRVGSITGIASFSFYPTKNLGALGDGGAVAVGDDETAARVRQIRDLGQTARYEHASMGINSRLDELQAALLQVKLEYLDAHNTARRERAAWYDELLRDVPDITLPSAPDSFYHIYHLYVIRHPRRDALRAHLKEQDIGTDVHYPKPLHRQPVFDRCRIAAGGTPVADQASREILSLPMFPGLSRAEVEQVTAAIRSF